jgi:hypothetical protein
MFERLQLSSHLCVCEGNPFKCRTLTGVQTVLPHHPDRCIRTLESSWTLKSVWTCCDDVWTDATLNYSKLLDTEKSPDSIPTSSGWMLLINERPDAFIGPSRRKQGVRLLLSWNLQRIFLEFWNHLLEACDIESCHGKALSISEK